MATTYTPPEVTVTQIRRSNAANVQPPLLPVVVVAPARQIEVRVDVGTYTSGQIDFTNPIPNLKSGAVLDDTSVSVFIEGYDTKSGKNLGLFGIEQPYYELGADDTQVTVTSDLQLEYSLLSTGNNNLAPNTVRATGDVSGTLFTDNEIDFAKRGAVIGNTYVVVDSPSGQAGTYVIEDIVYSNNTNHKVRLNEVDPVEKTIVLGYVDDDLVSSNFTTSGGAITATTITGSPTNTETYDDSGNTTNLTLINGVAVASCIGIGVKNNEYKGSNSITNGGQITSITGAGVSIPAVDSVTRVQFTPGTAVDSWKDLVAAAERGNWLRVVYTTGTTSRDFRITDIDSATYSLTLEAQLFGTANTDVTTLTADITQIALIETYRGKADGINSNGDVLKTVSSSATVYYEIQSVTPCSITFAQEVTIDTTTTSEWKRGPAVRNFTSTYDLLKVQSSGFYGDVSISYTADRTDLADSGLIELSDIQSVETELGLIHPDNPIALMAQQVVISGVAANNKSFYALATRSDTLTGYEEALETLEGADVYFLVPASQDAEILQAFKAHCEAQSAPEGKHERVLLASTELQTYLRYLPVTGENMPVGGKDSATVWLSTGTDFGGVPTGAMLKITDSVDGDPATATVVAEYRIVGVSSDSVETATEIDDAYTDNYFIIDSLAYSKTEQAEVWRDEAIGFASFRTMLVRPDGSDITYTDKTGLEIRDKTEVLPAYYAAASIAGYASYIQPQQPITNVPIPGIGRLYHSNTYFNPTQLNIIASGGNNVLVQATPTAAPSSRHQLMTDMTDLISREFSITRCRDFTAKYFRNSFTPYIGNRVINDETITQLKGIAEMIARGLVSSRVLNSCTIDSVYQDPDALDSVIVLVTIQVPFPCNKIKVTLYI